jgi:hypothetical protein
MKALAFAIAASLLSTGAYAQFPAATKGGASIMPGFPDVARVPAPPVAKPVPMPIPAPKIVVTPPVVTKQPVVVPPDTGKVEFGDGSRGKAPPAGADLASRYRRGAGAIGLPAVQKPRELPAVQMPEPKPGAMPLTPLDDPRLSKKEGPGKDASMQRLELQNAAQQEDQVYQSISNIERARSDTENSIVHNLK